jgi:two-component system heavy metal sensor histidine kinase CusS
LAVINQGPAIPPEHLPKLFDRFYRSDPARTGADQNHGLGLSIVAAIARMHGGRGFARSADRLTSIGISIRVSDARSNVVRDCEPAASEAVGRALNAGA